ncbi:VOC family protein [Aquamicrobium sp. LC103]|uniref:VOC family protein n=1 Tax=Aquamicrobium sp. LC103 TaxID=1120658 RepID=UPI00069A5055|nr:VOC family protein [Aquamicrobium sp. LC103]TKT75749.1 VOC family protein [Aquamicrobium sp. LC103]
MAAPDLPRIEGLRQAVGPYTQLGFVVRDLDAAVRHWVEVMGVGPFLFLNKGTGRPPAPSLFRGERVVVENRIAFGFIGDVQLELIEQVNDAPSPYLEFLAEGREGLQHLGYWVDDHAYACAQVEAAGYVMEFEIPIAGQPESILYYRSPNHVGPMIEIIPTRWRKSRAAVLEHVRAWKGGDPLLRYESYGDFLAAAKVDFS